MNSLELFNQLYTNENEPTFSSSLLDFFKSDLLNRLPGDAQILDLGSGSRSLFEEELGLSKRFITAVDYSPVAISKAKNKSPIKYLEIDITVPECLGHMLFDLIFDSHCLHCITDKTKREFAFKNIYHALKPTGIAAFEMMVYRPGEVLGAFGKHVVDARELEVEILAHGFKIIYFVIVRNAFFENENIRSDLLRVIIKK